MINNKQLKSKILEIVRVFFYIFFIVLLSNTISFIGNVRDKSNKFKKEIYYESGKLHSQPIFKEGTNRGVLKVYSEAGKLEAEVNFENNKENGLSTIYYENGEIKKEIHFVDGKMNGLYKEYYENGKLKEEMTFVNDKVNGKVKTYHPSGYMTEANFKDNKIEGLIHVYDKDRNLIKTIEYPQK